MKNLSLSSSSRLKETTVFGEIALTQSPQRLWPGRAISPKTAASMHL